MNHRQKNCYKTKRPPALYFQQTAFSYVSYIFYLFFFCNITYCRIQCAYLLQLPWPNPPAGLTFPSWQPFGRHAPRPFNRQFKSCPPLAAHSAWMQFAWSYVQVFTLHAWFAFGTHAEPSIAASAIVDTDNIILSSLSFCYNFVAFLLPNYIITFFWKITW